MHFDFEDTVCQITAFSKEMKQVRRADEKHEIDDVHNQLDQSMRRMRNYIKAINNLRTRIGSFDGRSLPYSITHDERKLTKVAMLRNSDVRITCEERLPSNGHNNNNIYIDVVNKKENFPFPFCGYN